MRLKERVVYKGSIDGEDLQLKRKLTNAMFEHAAKEDCAFALDYQLNN
ncbi:hypothetical protein NZF17_005213 [Salmonella enterica]|nr:hypothetical protein [Salmonella enterica]